MGLMEGGATGTNGGGLLELMEGGLVGLMEGATGTNGGGLVGLMEGGYWN